MCQEFKYSEIDFSKSKLAARAEGYKVPALADLLEVNYQSLQVILCGGYAAKNPDSSPLIRKVIQGLGDLGFLVLKEHGDDQIAP